MFNTCVQIIDLENDVAGVTKRFIECAVSQVAGDERRIAAVHDVAADQQAFCISGEPSDQDVPVIYGWDHFHMSATRKSGLAVKTVSIEARVMVVLIKVCGCD